MKHWQEAILLFAVFLLMGLDVKATVPNEDNFTGAAAWVEEWRNTTEKTLETEKGCSANLQEQFKRFIQKSEPALSAPNLTYDDRLYLLDAAYFVQNTAKARNCP